MSMSVQGMVANPATGASSAAKMRIDTGADVSVICLAIADKIGVSPQRFRTVIDVDGNQVEAPVFVVDIYLADSCELKNVEVAGLDLTGTGYTGLIGSNILNKGLLVRDGYSGSWYFVVNDNVCASGEVSDEKYGYLVAGLFGLALGVAGTLLLTRK